LYSQNIYYQFSKNIQELSLFLYEFIYFLPRFLMDLRFKDLRFKDLRLERKPAAIAGLVGWGMALGRVLLHLLSQ
jgi:hypothetical protein